MLCWHEFFYSMVWVKKTDDNTQLSLFDLILSQYLEKKVSFAVLQKSLSSESFLVRFSWFGFCWLVGVFCTREQ